VRRLGERVGSVRFARFVIISVLGIALVFLTQLVQGVLAWDHNVSNHRLCEFN
jgi:hypothetical protein